MISTCSASGMIVSNNVMRFILVKSFTILNKVLQIVIILLLTMYAMLNKVLQIVIILLLTMYAILNKVLQIVIILLLTMYAILPESAQKSEKTLAAYSNHVNMLFKYVYRSYTPNCYYVLFHIFYTTVYANV